MKKNIKYFLYTSLVLGFMQLEISAMEEEDFKSCSNSLIKRDTTTGVRITALEDTGRKTITKLDAIQQSQEEGKKERAETSNCLKQLAQENVELRRALDESRQRYAELLERLSRLEEKISPSRPLNAKFSSNIGWKVHSNSQWTAVAFNRFEGDDQRLRGDDLSFARIPEDGTYLLSAEYYWGARGGPAQTRTAIAINHPANILNDWHHHNLAQGTDIKSGIKRRAHLRTGDKVMLSIQGGSNANIFLGHFEFIIEKTL